MSQTNKILEERNDGKPNPVKLFCKQFFQHQNKPMYIGTVSLPELKKLNLKVAEFSARTENTPEEGYQRKVEETRARKFAKFLAEGNISPTNLLLSIRKEDVGKISVDNLESTQNENISLYDKNATILNIESDCPVWIVDGQHRWRGIEDLDDSRLEGFHMAFTLMWGMEPFEEANQFVIINKTQKAVRTDLAERFIAKAYKMRGKFSVLSDPNIGLFKKAVWVSRAIQILDTLIDPERRSVWANKVQLPNEPRAKTMTVTQSAFTNSLQQLLDKLGPFSNEDLYNECEIVDIVDAFWNAVRINCPTPFEMRSDMQSPNDYAIQQTIGVSSLHRVLAMIWNDLNGSIKLEDFEDLLAVDGIKDVEKWDRRIVNENTGGKGGQWTMMGTNQKAFRIIADKIYSQIRETKKYKQLITKKKNQ